MIGILASGNGTNFQSVAEKYNKFISFLFCNNSEAGVIIRAQKLGIPSFASSHKDFKTREEHEKQIFEIIDSFKSIKIILLLGYMRVLSCYFFDEVNKRKILVLNIHPAHLADYKGSKGYEYAFNSNFPRWGLSIHKVIPEIDSGEIISSFEFPVPPYLSLEEFKELGLKFEHSLLLSSIGNIIKEFC